MNVRALCFTAALCVTVGLHGQANTGSIEVPGEVRALLQAKGEGVQTYTCTQVQDGQHWVLKGPNAKLLDSSGNVIGTHFAGPTWKLNDSGTVQGELVASRPAPEANSVPWLLLRAKAGTAAGSLGGVTFIRRTDTRGGVPTGGCQVAADIGKTLEVPYSATYTFYTPN
jgi:hypothetical protein